MAEQPKEQKKSVWFKLQEVLGKTQLVRIETPLKLTLDTDKK